MLLGRVGLTCVDGNEGGGGGEEGTDQMFAVISAPAGMWYPSYTSSVMTRCGNPFETSIQYYHPYN